ncbi:MAG TPA: PPC domain-containing protein [Thermoanaerobaculia bacterium]|nr:PPC domain-containing protein [Thermoanaerobaculia bacterium]
MKRLIVVAFLAATTVYAQSNDVDKSTRERALRAARDAVWSQVHTDTTCPATQISPPATINGYISYATCASVIGTLEDVYSVNVTAGQTIDIDYLSHSFDTFLYMYLGNGTSAQTQRVSFLDINNQGTSEAKIHYTFTAAGTYLIECETLFTPGYPTLPVTGPYTLTVSLTGTQPPPPTSSAAQIVPIVGHLNGLGGSAFRSDLKLYNPSGSTITGKIKFTPRGQSASTSDPVISFNIGPKAVLFYPDVYLNGYPSGSGAARVAITRDNASSTPLIVDTSTYTANSDGGELGQSPTVMTDFAASGTTLTGVLGKNSERSNLFIMTGSSGATIQWTYRDTFGGSATTLVRSYPQDSTTQLAVSDLLGFSPSANSSLEAQIQSGTARVALSPVNNVSNQGRWIDFR